MAKIFSRLLGKCVQFFFFFYLHYSRLNIYTLDCDFRRDKREMMSAKGEEERAHEKREKARLDRLVGCCCC